MRLMRWTVCFAFLAACGDSSGPKIDPDQYVGTWTVNVPAVAGCWPAFAVNFAIPPDAADEAGQGLMNFVSATGWWFPSSPTNRRLLTGNIDWGRDSFAVVFTLGTQRARIDGVSPSPSRLSGTFTDTDGAFTTGLFCPNGSQVQVTATK